MKNTLSYQLKRIFISFQWLCIYCALSTTANATNLVQGNGSPAHGNIDVDILEISQEIKDALDREIRPIRNKEKRAIELHYMMFAPEKWNIDYSSAKTYTAQQTFDVRQGNCISMAALYVAAARYVNLPAKFQTVTVPNNWSPKEDYYIVSGHVNAVIEIGGDTVNVEFLRTFFDTESTKTKKRKISDKKAYAEYHNNVAMELVEDQQFELAKRHMEKAVAFGPGLDFVWSNYGVLLKFNEEFELAEQKYRKALKLNKRNFSALTNLYVLLEETGRTEEAAKLAKKVERYSKKNPHYLSRLAETALHNEKYENAITLINKAIKRDDSVARFFEIKAKALLYSGNNRLALKALKKAKALSEDTDDFEFYEKKVNTLLSTM